VLCTGVLAASTPKQESTDLAKMKQILRVATAGLADKNYRVIFAAEDNRTSLGLHYWIVTLQEYPADYKTVDDQEIRVMASGPPCASGKAAEFCSISDVPGETVFRGRFDLDDAKGHFRRFEGNIVSTASKMSAFRDQLAAHQQWTQAEIAAALASAGAKFGPDKEKEFRATLPVALNTLEKAFGPMRLHKVSSMKPTFLTLPSGQRGLIGWPAYWSVIAIPLRRPNDRVVMYFEPFEGQLQQLVATGLFQKWDPKAKKFKWEYLDPDQK
jgi:hypothetical protein